MVLLEAGLLAQLDGIGAAVANRTEGARDVDASREIIAVRPGIGLVIAADALASKLHDALLIGMNADTGVAGWAHPSPGGTRTRWSRGPGLVGRRSGSVMELGPAAPSRVVGGPRSAPRPGGAQAQRKPPDVGARFIGEVVRQARRAKLMSAEHFASMGTLLGRRRDASLLLPVRKPDCGPAA